VVYTALSEETARAELIRLAARHNLDLSSFLPRRLYILQVDLEAVLDLTSEEALQAVGLRISDVQSDDPSACQLVGDAAHKLSLEGILAPSAASTGPILAIFELNLRPDSVVEAQSFASWP